MRPLLISLLFFFWPFLVSASVALNEVAWMGSRVDGVESKDWWRYEWFELYNGSADTMDLGGWKVEFWRDSLDFTMTLMGTVAPDGYFLIASSEKIFMNFDFNYANLGGKLNNNGEKIILKDTSGNVADTLDAAGGWPAGDNNTKDTMQKQGDIWVTASPTPRAQNFVVSTSEPSGVTPSSPQTSISSGPFITQNISAYAGEDKKVVVGSASEFLGSAKGINGEALENARFWWNFGDGGTKEGRAVPHSFEIPGIYTVGLHVSSGTYSASDYLKVTVVPNQLVVKSVLKGADGFIKLDNQSEVEIDVGGWVISDGLANFVIPPKTKIGSKSEAAFSNKATALFKNNTTASVLYPNGVLALLWKPVISPAPQIIAESVDRPSGPKGAVETPKKEEVVSSQQVLSSAEDKSVNSEAAQINRSASSGAGKLFFAAALGLGFLASFGFLLLKWKNQKF